MKGGKQYYRRVWAARPDALLFHQDWWLDTVCGKDNWSFVVSENEEAVLPYCFEKKWGFMLIRPPKLTPYLPIIGKKDNPNTLCELIQKLPRCAEFMMIAPPGNEIKLNNRLISGTILHRPTYILSLAQKNLLDGYSSQRKRHIKKAEKYLQFVENQFDVEHFIFHHKQSFERKSDIYPYNKELVDKIVSAAQAQQAAYTIQAYLNEQLIAQIACFYDRHTMYYLLGTFDIRYKQYNPMSALMHRCITFARSIGLKQFDFEGSSDPGIASFFGQFGGKELYTNIYTALYNPLWKVIKRFRF